MVAFGKTVETIARMLLDRSIVTSLTASLASSGALFAVPGLVGEDCDEVLLKHSLINAQVLAQIVFNQHPIGCVISLLPFGVIAQMMFV